MRALFSHAWKQFSSPPSRSTHLSPLLRMMQGHRYTAVRITTQLSTHPIKGASSFHPRAAIFAAGAAAAAAQRDSVHCSPLVGSCGIPKPPRDPSSSKRQSSPPPLPSSQAVLTTLDHGCVGVAGEDAFFISADNCVLGVADGVGGWATIPGADSSAVSKNLMTYALEQAQNHSSHDSPALMILQAAYQRSKQDSIVGSTTACIVAYDRSSSTLHYANLGDSGFLLVRHPASTAEHFFAPQIHHGFNYPFQLGKRSPDQPKHAKVGKVTVGEGDILVLATDGLFDNVEQRELVETCHQYINKTSSSLSSLDDVAHHLALTAYRLGSDPGRDSPFSRSARENGLIFFGGKLDDCTVIVAEFKPQHTVPGTKEPHAPASSAATKTRSKL